MHKSALLPLAALCLAVAAPAQPPAATPGATLTGHVLCADTNAPARFAKVILKSTAPSGPGDDIFGALSNAETSNVSRCLPTAMLRCLCRSTRPSPMG